MPFYPSEHDLRNHQRDGQNLEFEESQEKE